ncbi:MAG: polymerase sigma factor RpoE [Myxococcaceae bacterium]|nr:polymerase sigma factor RpoE [Myxococcaceae bacterium]
MEEPATSQPDPAAPTAAAALDDAAFTGMFRREFGYVQFTLARLGVARRDLDDATHDVFVAVYRQRAAIDASRALRPLLFGYAFRVASQHRRAAWTRRAVLDDAVEAVDAAPDAGDQLDAGRNRALVLAALATVDLDRRAVILLADFDGVAQPEIAAVLGIPLGTVYSRLRLAREDFAAAIHRLRAKRGER